MEHKGQQPAIGSESTASRSREDPEEENVPSGPSFDYATIDHWLDRLIDLPPVEAQQALRECTDAAVRAEVASLLGFVETTAPDDALERGIGSVAGDLLHEAGEDPGELLRGGRRLGRYELIEILGRGGMGVVWRARRADGEFDQQVAIKLLPQGLETAAAEARFARERQILARLEHPGIARLIDGGVSDEGTPYLVMEMVRGEPIDRWVQRHRSDARQVVEFMIQVCDAVAFAHRRMVVHRDLKPSNLLVEESEDGRGAAVRLLDFGVAKFLDSGDRNLTGTALAAPLTPNYAAPEQIRGEAATAATDVYSLGVLLFELLVGEVPHDRSALTLSEAIEESTRDTTLPPSAVLRRNESTPGGRVSPISGDLDMVVLKALRTEPRQRYADVAALRDDLEAVLESRPVSARPLTLGYRASRFVRRNRWPVAAAAAVLSALLLGLLGTAWQARRAGQEARRAQRTVEFLESLLLEANPEETSLEDPSVVALLERGVERLDQELADAPEVRARVLHLIGRAFDGLGRSEEGKQLNERALQESLVAFGPASSEVAWILVALSDPDRLASVAESREQLDRALEIILRNEGQRSQEAVEMYNQLGNLYRFDPERAERYHGRALEIARSLYGEEDPWVATCMGSLGSVLRSQGRSEEGLQLLTQAVEIFERTDGSGAPSAITMRNNLAVALHEVGRLDEAEPQYREALRLSATRLGADHPVLVGRYGNLGRLLMDLGRFEEARQPVERAAALASSRMDADNLQRVAAEINRSSVLLEVGDLDSAERGYRSALKVFHDTLGAGHAFSVRVGLLLGRQRLLAGDLDEASELLAPVLDEAAVGIPGRPSVRALLDLARLGRRRGRLAQAERMLDLARSREHEVADAGATMGGAAWESAELLVEAGLQVVATGGRPSEDQRDAAAQLCARMPKVNWRVGECRAVLDA